MKKVLIVTYTWPPRGGVGVTRVLKFAKYLPQFGWEPFILTAAEEAPGMPYNGEDRGLDLGRIRVSRSPYAARYPFLPHRVREILLQPDVHRGWFEAGTALGARIIEREGIDLVFSSSPPETSHLIGRALKERCGVPWVADLRDLWSGCHFVRRGVVAGLLARAAERRTLAAADAVTTVSAEWARDLERSSGVAAGRIRVVTNGFDERDFDGIAPVRQEKFVVSYTGKLHRSMQDPEPFFRAVGGLLKEGAVDRKAFELRFHIFGYRKADIAALAKRYGLEDVVKECPPVGYGESLAAQHSATVLAFFQWRGAPGWYSAKLFEYLGAKRPVLAVSPNGEGAAAALVRQLGAGTVASDESGIRRALGEWYREWRATGSVAYRGDEKALARYTRRETAKTLAGIFDGLAAKG